jgi:predicted ribosome quality control (RQC) complex YloA/Tae2 family protein
LGNLKNIVKGANPLELPNPYSETGETISIPMNINKTPQGNAQYYFNLARRLEKAQVRIQVQILTIEKELAKMPKELPEEINGLKELANRLGLTDERKEPKTKVKKAGEKKLAGIISFPLSDGSIIYVGRNAEGNNRLTFQIAKGEDLWFHTRDAHGSHVILSAGRKGELPIRKNILLAGGLTAYFSKLRQDSKVEVAYTRVKYVRKTKKLGLVTYSQEKSLLVKPISPEEMRKKLDLGSK